MLACATSHTDKIELSNGGVHINSCLYSTVAGNDRFSINLST